MDTEKQFADPRFPNAREIVDVCLKYTGNDSDLKIFELAWPEDDWLAIAPEDGQDFRPFDLNLWTDEAGEPFITYYVVRNDQTDTSMGLTISVKDYYFINGGICKNSQKQNC